MVAKFSNAHPIVMEVRYYVAASERELQEEQFT